MITTLAAVARHMRLASDPWWIIGSAAVALQGCATEVSDIDLLTSERDARALTALLDIPISLSDRHPLFRSPVFARWHCRDWIVEIMGGLTIADGAGWSAVVPVTRVRVPVGDEAVFVPERDELVAILCRFGRPKDMRRAQLLSAS